MNPKVLYTQHQMLSTTKFVAYFSKKGYAMQINLIYKINVLYRYKIIKQLSYFANISDGEFDKKHIGVNLFSLQLCLHE